MNAAGPPTTCVLCGLPPRRAYELRNGAALLRCPECGLGWWAWPAFDPQAFYDESYFQSSADAKGYDDYAALEAGVARTARARLRRIRRLCAASAPGRLLEIGCGTGVFLAEARRAGWDVSGVEVSVYAAERARQRGLPVTSQAIEDLDLPAATFDCICLWDVIEHVCDPAGVLGRAGAALRPGGVLALSTGDLASLCARLSRGGWHLFNLPEHLFFFTSACLRGLLARAGCRVDAVVRETNWVPLAYIVERLGKSRGRFGRLVAALLRVAPRALRARLLVPATLLDVVGVYAVRS